MKTIQCAHPPHHLSAPSLLLVEHSVGSNTNNP